MPPVSPKLDYVKGDLLPCKLCGFGFYEPFEWFEHWRKTKDHSKTRVRQGDRMTTMYGCPYCKRTMREWANIETHINRHLCYKPYCCPEFISVYDPSNPEATGLAQCPFRSEDRAYISIHRKQQHGYITRNPRAKVVETEIQPTVAAPEVPAMPQIPEVYPQDNFLANEVPLPDDVLAIFNEFNVPVVSSAAPSSSENPSTAGQSDLSTATNIFDPATIFPFEWEKPQASADNMGISFEKWPTFE